MALTRGTESIGDHSLDLYLAEGEDFDFTGEVIWPAARILAHWVVANLPALAGKNVLELGAGSSPLSGLFAALTAKNVVLTDGEPAVLERCRQNVRLNSSKFAANCLVRHLPWGDGAALATMTGETIPAQKFDVLLGSDVIYSEVSVPPLMETIDAALPAAVDPTLTADQQPYCLLCYEHRTGNPQRHIPPLLLQHHLISSEIPLASFLSEAQRSALSDGRLSPFAMMPSQGTEMRFTLLRIARDPAPRPPIGGIAAPTQVEVPPPPPAVE
ncbi:hypothetical protein PAPYR_1644 [Paratrimastix pyriformis]|uniref:Uncharacterized protein n=1 Tax=Paratrimastix pyriformis TaxID=342808 RepID=A0ABQ8UX55_9EUKA|nr:hypothetical protein PAPYR_1644 [Paratrimastix pyriformis]